MNHSTKLLDEKATVLAKNYLQMEAELLSVLMEMRKRRLFAEFNYSGVFDYCERRLKLSRAQSYYFKCVAEKSEEVPELKSAVLTGELTLSQARCIAPVINQQNQEEWVTKAKTLTQKELEREVTAVNPKAHVRETLKPIAKDLSELRVTVSGKTETDIEVLKEVLSQKLRRAATLADVIAWAAEVTREKFDPIRKAERRQKVSSRKHATVPRATHPPGRRWIQASVAHRLALRDEARCTHVSEDGRRCVQRRWLHRHHVVEVQRGGTDSVDNLRLVCQAHHKWLHAPRPTH